MIIGLNNQIIKCLQKEQEKQKFIHFQYLFLNISAVIATETM